MPRASLRHFFDEKRAYAYNTLRAHSPPKRHALYKAFRALCLLLMPAAFIHAACKLLYSCRRPDDIKIRYNAIFYNTVVFFFHLFTDLATDHLMMLR